MAWYTSWVWKNQELFWLWNSFEAYQSAGVVSPSPVARLILCSRLGERIKRAKAGGRGKYLVVHLISEGGGGEATTCHQQSDAQPVLKQWLLWRNSRSVRVACPLAMSCPPPWHCTSTVQQKLNTDVVSALFGSKLKTPYGLLCRKLTPYQPNPV